ncbi:MAG: penicillin-binding transpeptidase domain-containing protein [Patescibacteria group bacterium]
MSKRISARHLKQLSRDINPDEIFLDSKNLPSYDKDQFEGRIEKSISRGAIFGVFLSFLLVAFIFLAKVASLQFVHGEEFLKKSENNRLDHTPLFAMRGVIFDRNKVPLAWNSFDDEATRTALIASDISTTTEKMPFPHRSYITSPGFGHTLGYVSYPKRDSKGNFYQEAFIGKDGLEEYYNEILSGKNGLQIVETDALGRAQSGSIVEEPQNGAALTLGIDARVQEKLHTTIRDLAKNVGYMAGAGAIMDVETGELLALTSYPEYESDILSEGKNKKIIQSYNLDKRAVFLDRAVSGIYTPGSIVKPFMAVAALSEGVITPEKQILSTGSISIQNPYYPDIKSVFNDWKAHGWTDMRHAIAVSSDVYFYEIGGGYEGQKGIGIANIEKYARLFGFGSPTGIDITDEKSGTIPSPEWKAKMFKGEAWRLGDTYHTVIGQYGFQVTILQALRGIASIANGGTLVTPHLVKDPVREFSTTQIAIPAEHFAVAREGMRMAVREGTVGGLNVGFVTVAGKTGTAEIDTAKKYINSWVVGFFPYEKPRYAFAVVMERGPYANTLGGVFVMRQMLDWMHENTLEYLGGGI